MRVMVAIGSIRVEIHGYVFEVDILLSFHIIVNMLDVGLGLVGVPDTVRAVSSLLLCGVCCVSGEK